MKQLSDQNLLEPQIETSDLAYLGRFARSFVPFGLLLAAALIAPELTQNLPLHRAIYTIWAATVLLIPAMCAFIFVDETEAARNYWSWLWTFSFLIYCVHFYYAVFVLFGGVSAVFAPRPAGQGLLVAGVNFLLTFLWGLDVILLWTVHTPGKWVRMERWFAHALVFVVFTYTLLRLRPNGVTKPLGIALALGVVASIILKRLLRETRKA